jgi:hypothetical protein
MSEAEPSREAVAMRRTLLKVYRSLYACAWLSAYAVVAVAMARAYVIGANPFRDDGYGDMAFILLLDAGISIAFMCAVTALFAFAARRTRRLHESLTRAAPVPSDELKAWDDFWRLNPFDHAAFGNPWQVDADRTARIQLNLRISASLMCLAKVGQLMLFVYLAQNHGATLFKSFTTLFEATYVIGMEAFAVYGFGSLWLASNRLTSPPQADDGFRQRQRLALDRIGNFLIALALYHATTQGIALYRLCKALIS